jgi:nucleoside-diphosphate-sugar epimerase
MSSAPKDMWNSILITGASGAVGTAVVRQLQERSPNTRLWLTSRRATPTPSQALVNYLFWDLSDPRAAGSFQVSEALAEIDCVIHLAADVRWGAPRDEALRNNLETSRNLATALKRHAPRLQRFVHMSTAFVTRPTQRFPGNDVIVENGRTFTNAYEFSKFKTEEWLFESDLPWVIVRPPLVIGSYEDGRIGRYNGLYPVIRMVAGEKVPALPGYEDAVIDLAPVDLVAAVTLAVAAREWSDHTITTLTGGADCLTFREIVDLTLAHVNRYRTARGHGAVATPPIIEPARYVRFFKPFLISESKPRLQKILDLLDVYTPYLSAVEPIQIGTHEVAVVAADIRPHFSTIIERWCSDNPSASTAPPFNWKSVLAT